MHLYIYINLICIIYLYLNYLISIKKNIEGGFYCSQDCFKSCWSEHKKKHNGKFKFYNDLYNI